MERDSRKALDISLGLLRDYQEEQAERVQKIESKVDRYEDELGTYLVKLNNKDLSEKDSHSVSIMLHCIGDFERISDHAVNIMESARELHEKNLSFSPEARTELQVLVSVVGRIVDTAYDVFDKQDMNLTRDVEPLEEMVDELSRETETSPCQPSAFRRMYDRDGIYPHRPAHQSGTYRRPLFQHQRLRNTGKRESL